ncbi:glycosyltransferase family 2 protein [Candidatus Saccharibacteria bacterium]|nr:glycosyltransferase family 2 protein [Candidatus Saccharibacteria bacterium]
MKASLISIVVPCYNEEGNVVRLLGEVNRTMRGQDFEIIFVNDGSSDLTLELLKSLALKDKRLKYLSFSRNFGHQAALRAGLKYAKGDAVVSMDADLQHPPNLLPKLIQKWHEGYEVVYTVRKDTNDTGVGKRATSALFYKMINFLSGLKIEEGAADFRLLDRKVVNVINDQQESSIFLRGYISWVGFRQIGIPYEPAKRFSGNSKYNLKKMISLAGTGVTQFSIKPLRLAHILAVVAFLMSLVYVVYAAVAAISGHTIPGWLSLVILFVFMQGVQFLLLGMIGEYLGRTFMQTKSRPEYIISETNDGK